MSQGEYWIVEAWCLPKVLDETSVSEWRLSPITLSVPGWRSQDSSELLAFLAPCMLKLILGKGSTSDNSFMAPSARIVALFLFSINNTYLVRVGWPVCSSEDCRHQDSLESSISLDCSWRWWNQLRLLSRVPPVSAIVTSRDFLLSHLHFPGISPLKSSWLLC